MERDQATELIHNLLRGMVGKKASDLFITSGSFVTLHARIPENSPKS